MDKELKKLNRKELIEILIQQQEKIEKLEYKIEEYNKEVENREILIDECGTIAEAALKLNGVYEAIDKAASQYLYNIERVCKNEKNKKRKSIDANEKEKNTNEDKKSKEPNNNENKKTKQQDIDKKEKDTRRKKTKNS